MFLHAHHTVVTHPDSGVTLRLEAPLDKELLAVLAHLDAQLQREHAEAI